MGWRPLRDNTNNTHIAWRRLSHSKLRNCYSKGERTKDAKPGRTPENAYNNKKRESRESRESAFNQRRLGSIAGGPVASKVSKCTVKVCVVVVRRLGLAWLGSARLDFTSLHLASATGCCLCGWLSIHYGNGSGGDCGCEHVRGFSLLRGREGRFLSGEVSGCSFFEVRLEVGAACHTSRPTNAASHTVNEQRRVSVKVESKAAYYARRTCSAKANQRVGVRACGDIETRKAVLSTSTLPRNLHATPHAQQETPEPLYADCGLWVVWAQKPQCFLVN